MFIKILKNSYPVNDFELKFHTLILVISLKHIISRASLRSTLENPKSFYSVYDQKDRRKVNPQLAIKQVNSNNTVAVAVVAGILSNCQLW